MNVIQPAYQMLRCSLADLCAACASDLFTASLVCVDVCLLAGRVSRKYSFSKTSCMDVLQCDFMTLITLTVLINATASAEQTIKRIRIRSPLFSRCCFPDSPLLT